ncbi:hypothetical protein AO894_11080, partial [Pseudomonas aeruginosa]
VIDAKRDADGSFTVDLDVLRRQQEVTDKAPGAGQQALEHEPGEVIDTVSGEITKSAQRQPADQQPDTGTDELNLE